MTLTFYLQVLEDVNRVLNHMELDAKSAMMADANNVKKDIQ